MAPVLLLHGGAGPDGARRPLPLARPALPGGELRLSPDDGHLSVLDSAESALEWLRAHAA